MAFWATTLPYARQSGELVIELNKRNPAPPPPYELLGAITDSQYQERMKALTRHLQRYSWSTVERIYVFFALAISFIIPWPIMFLVDRAFIGNLDTATNPTDQFGNPILTSSQVKRIENARLASFGILVGMFFLLWTPYFIFKTIGNRRRRALLTTFTQQDCAPPRPQHTHLVWGIRNSSTFHGRAQIIVNLPLNAMGLKGGSQSSFHPQAYLPAYIAAAPQGQFMPPPGPPPGAELRDEKV